MSNNIDNRDGWEKLDAQSNLAAKRKVESTGPLRFEDGPPRPPDPVETYEMARFWLIAIPVFLMVVFAWLAIR